MDLTQEFVGCLASSSGFPDLEPEVLDLLRSDIEYHVRNIVWLAKYCMRHSKRSKLLPLDIKNALSKLYFEGHMNNGYSKTTWLGSRKDDLPPRSVKPDFTVPGDPLLDIVDVVDKFYYTPVPRDCHLQTHWLAVEGMQPLIPENPCTEDQIHSSAPLLAAALQEGLLQRRRATVSAEGSQHAPATPPAPSPTPKAHAQAPKTGDVASISKTLSCVDVADGAVLVPLGRKNILSREMELFYKCVVSAVLPERTKKRKNVDQSALLDETLQSLRTNPGLQQLLPYFTHLVFYQIRGNMNSSRIISAMLSVTDCLLSNQHFVLEPYVHQLIPVVLSCVVSCQVGEQGSAAHWGLRARAVDILATMCERFASKYPDILSQLAHLLARPLLDKSSSLATRYGCICGLSRISPTTFQLALLPVIGHVLAQLDGPVMAKDPDALHCLEAVMDAVVRFLSTSLSRQPAKIRKELCATLDEATACRMEDIDVLSTVIEALEERDPILHDSLVVLVGVMNTVLAPLVVRAVRESA